MGEGSEPANLPQIRRASLASPPGWRSGHPKISIPGGETAKNTPPGIEPANVSQEATSRVRDNCAMAGLTLPTPTTIKRPTLDGGVEEGVGVAGGEGCSESAANIQEPALSLAGLGQATGVEEGGGRVEKGGRSVQIRQREQAEGLVSCRGVFFAPGSGWSPTNLRQIRWGIRGKFAASPPPHPQLGWRPGWFAANLRQIRWGSLCGKFAASPPPTPLHPHWLAASPPRHPASAPSSRPFGLPLIWREFAANSRESSTHPTPTPSSARVGRPSSRPANLRHALRHIAISGLISGRLPRNSLVRSLMSL